MHIEWNKVTWYSKLLSAIFMLGIVPILTFFVGTQYEEIRSSQDSSQTLINSIQNRAVAHSIRSVNLGDYLADNVPVVLDDATTTYREACNGASVDLGPSDNSDIQYGDLLGDGSEEALVTTHSCLSGSQGYDIFGVFGIRKDGAIEELKFNDNDGSPDYLGTSEFFGKQFAEISDYLGRKAVIIHGLEKALNPSDPSCCASGVEYKVIYLWDGNRFLFVKNPISQISVPGMQQYKDSDFGFSFWYPAGSTLREALGSDADLWGSYDGGSIIKTVTVAAPDAPDEGIAVQEFRSSDTGVTDNSGCGPADGCPSSVRYYFDKSTHLWMKESFFEYGRYSSPSKIAPADISDNSMGGLHVFNGNARFGDNVIVPLSARNFVIVQNVSAGTYQEELLAHTIVASDPSVATPVSAALQAQAIQSEADAYK